MTPEASKRVMIRFTEFINTANARDARGPSGHAQAEVGPDHQHQLACRHRRLQALRSLQRCKIRSGRPVGISGSRGRAFRHQDHDGRTRLLPDGPARCQECQVYARSSIEDYAAEGSAENMWSGYHGAQQGDPAKLGDILVKIIGIDNPPNQFVAGSDALAAARPALEARLEELRAFEDLSKSTDGSV